MIIECPNCHTKFNVKDELIPEEGRKVKCSKCKNIFLAKREAPKPPPEEVEEVFNLTEDKPTKIDRFEEEEEKEEELLEKDLEKITQKYKKPSVKKPKKVKEKSHGPFYLITLGMLIIAMVVAGAYLFFKTRNATPPFTFLELKGNFYENKNYGTILVLQGKLQNNKKVSFTKVKIKGVVFDNTGNIIKEGETYLGNIFSEEELLNLKEEEVRSLIYDQVVLKPLSQLPFMVIIYNPPKISYSFQVEVVDYQRLKSR